MNSGKIGSTSDFRVSSRPFAGVLRTPKISSLEFIAPRLLGPGAAAVAFSTPCLCYLFLEEVFCAVDLLCHSTSAPKIQV